MHGAVKGNLNAFKINSSDCLPSRDRQGVGFPETHLYWALLP